MASVLPSVINESLFQCRLCCRSAADPRLLPCLHVFCRTCLLRHVSRIRDAAAAQHQRAVAQNEPKDQLSQEPVDKLLSTTAVSQRDPDVPTGLPASNEGQPPVAATASTRPAANIPFVVAGDEGGYEVPQIDDYEDLDSAQTYANDVMVSASHVVASKHGYAVMASKPLTSAVSSSRQVS